jgi:hypothetical protein
MKNALQFNAFNQKVQKVQKVLHPAVEGRTCSPLDSAQSVVDCEDNSSLGEGPSGYAFKIAVAERLASIVARKENSEEAFLANIWSSKDVFRTTAGIRTVTRRT